jgi:hypothetical protein
MILHTDAAFVHNAKKVMTMKQREWNCCCCRTDCNRNSRGYYINSKIYSSCRKTVSVPQVHDRFRRYNVPAGGALFLTRHDQTSSRRTVMPREVSSSPYYLLSTFAIWRTILVTTCLLFLARIVGQTVTPMISSKSIILSVPPSTAMGGVCHHDHPKVWWWLSRILNDRIVLRNNWLLTKVRDVTLPLLSSACCAIQLFLNAFAGVGCAGFNTTLGPLRPYFISLLLYTTITTFSRDKMYYFLISWFVAFMPELVHIVNVSKYASSDDNNNKAPSLIVESDHPKLIVVELDIQDMGCVACINKINGSMRSSSSSSCLNVVEARSWLNEDGVKGGRTRVVYQVEEATKEVVQNATEEAMKVVKDAGFQCEVESVQCI